jgi:signal transduction histidine kinase
MVCTEVDTLDRRELSVVIRKENSLLSADELRRHAEELLQERTQAQHSPRTDEVNQRLVHELEVHQIALELQNEELLHAKNEVDRSLDIYTDLYDFAPVGYFTLDQAGTIKAVNLGGASLFGFERTRLLNRSFVTFVQVSARPLFSDFLVKVFALQGKESCEMALTPDEKHPLFVRIEALADAVGKQCRVVVLDITERRIVEADLAVKKFELEEINRSLEVRIATAVEEIRQKDQMLILQDRLSVMGEMINNIAHQWNQPLNTLGLIVQQLPIYYESETVTRKLVNESTQQAMKQIMYMSRTVNDFRDLFKVDKESIAFIVNDVIMRTLSLVEKTFTDQMIEIALHLEGNPKATGFPNEYSQVLLNILLNARDVLVERKVDDALISIHSFVEGGKSVVTVTDNAGGIAEEIVDKLFDAYFSTKGDKGTGIGLFMSKTIIEKSMGGFLTVRNTPDGAEFRIEV